MKTPEIYLFFYTYGYFQFQIKILLHVSHRHVPDMSPGGHHVKFKALPARPYEAIVIIEYRGRFLAPDFKKVLRFYPLYHLSYRALVQNQIVSKTQKICQHIKLNALN